MCNREELSANPQFMSTLLANCSIRINYSKADKGEGVVRARQDSRDAIAADHAGLAVLAEAILRARFLATLHLGDGMDPACVAELHQLLDLVHNIPRALGSPPNSYRSDEWLRRDLEGFEMQWGPQSPARCTSGALHFPRRSLAETYDAALLHSRRLVDDVADVERFLAQRDVHSRDR